ncbi:unnamed protein product, partial [Discosporangium mesarthrocarpum]
GEGKGQETCGQAFVPECYEHVEKAEGNGCMIKVMDNQGLEVARTVEGQGQGQEGRVFMPGQYNHVETVEDAPHAMATEEEDTSEIVQGTGRTEEELIGSMEPDIDAFEKRHLRNLRIADLVTAAVFGELRGGDVGHDHQSAAPPSPSLMGPGGRTGAVPWEDNVNAGVSGRKGNMEEEEEEEDEEEEQEQEQGQGQGQEPRQEQVVVKMGGVVYD